jgi:hypothetical protein
VRRRAAGAALVASVYAACAALLAPPLVQPAQTSPAPAWVLAALLGVALVASALTMHVTARMLTGSAPGAVAAGLVWAFSPPRLAAPPLPPVLLFYVLLPLAFLFLYRLIARRRLSDAVWLGVVAGATSLAAPTERVATWIALTACAAILAGMVGRWRDVTLLARLLIAAVLAALLSVPATAWRPGEGPSSGASSPDGSSGGSAANYLRVAPGNIVYGRTGLLPSAAEEDRPGERPLFPGLVAVLLALIGLVRRPGDSRPLACSLLGVVLVGLAAGSIAPTLFALAGLGALAVATITGTRGLAPAGQRRSPVRLVALAACALVIESFTVASPAPGVDALTDPDESAWPPATAEDLRAVPPPPRPVLAPPAAGERAVYRVSWSGGTGGAGLSAGELVIGADAATARAARVAATGAEPPAPEPGSGTGVETFRFMAMANTAEWFSPIFEAQDTFETWVDAALFPLVGHQHLLEGGQRVERLAVYDPARHVVRIDDVDLAMAAGSRDPLSALQYVRAAPLEPGRTLRIPVNEAGRNLVVDVIVRLDTIRVDGRPARTFRLDARVFERAAARLPLDLTLWLSRDDRRLPLRVAVATSLGAFRAELVSCEPGVTRR